MTTEHVHIDNPDYVWRPFLERKAERDEGRPEAVSDERWLWVERPLAEPYWRLSRGSKTAMTLDDARGGELAPQAASMPVTIGEAIGRVWWLYQGDVYSTKEDLEPDEAQALIEEQANKKRLKITRAKTVAAMAGNLDRRGKRQPIPREVKVAVWQRDQGRCVQCGNNENLEFDHIVPHSRGGADTERNIQLLCADCNREKGPGL